MLTGSVSPLSPDVNRADDEQFINGTWREVTGWCEDVAALFTLSLLRYQQRNGWLAPSCEIGVYRGKYLSLLRHANAVEGQLTVGFDTFEWVSRDTVEGDLKRLGLLDGISLVTGNSLELSSADILRQLNDERAGLFSVDGSHDAGPVAHDIGLAEAVLQPWGVVAIDDFLNSYAIGVTEGVIRYWALQQTDLVPFCFAQNKLFAARKEFVSAYADHVLAFVQANKHIPALRLFLDARKEKGDAWVRQELLGAMIWIIR